MATPLHAQPEADDLLLHLHVLAADSMEGRQTGTVGNARARSYIVETFREIGLEAPPSGYEQTFDVLAESDTVQGVNVIGLIPGTEQVSRMLVLTAHYDHLGMRNGLLFNGADDNASGVAALLELARVLQAAPLRHTVVVAMLDAEEIGLQGALAFVDEGPVEVDSVLLNVNLDMVSRSEAAELYVAGTAHDPHLKPILAPVAQRSAIRLRFGHDTPGPTAGYDWTHASDHAVFHEKGIPFLYFGVEGHPGYHRPSDDAEAITPAFFVRAVATILDAVRTVDIHLATDPERTD